MTQTGFGYKYCSYLVVFSSLRIHFSFRLCFWVDCHKDELYTIAFGPKLSSAIPLSDTGAPPPLTIKALYAQGLKRNDCSGPAQADSFNGLYSLASTVEKGQGQGCVQPAIQTLTPEATALILRTLQIVHKLQQIIFPCSLSQREWEMAKFVADDNNIFVFGGLGAGATGLQFNVLSGTDNLTI
ncbi:unnamed protein product [Mycena citricolor]|uniref:Uncharacterized protein n=1 Tax=Mycena citricolor TaxID=2018698 RepID=A0AAD2Q224_9AGAR|nr:unnamed protein product [Mycena citricolor]